MMEVLEPRWLLTVVAPGGTDKYGDGNLIWPNGTVVNASSHTIWVYSSNKGWVDLPPGTHTPSGSDVDGWTFDPTKIEGPRDPSGDPLIRKVGDGHTGKAMNTADGQGVQHDAGGSSTTSVHYPEEMNGKHPKDLPPGHNGTPDSDLQNVDADLVRGDAFDFWYDDPNNGMQDPNDPGYVPPRPPPPPPPGGGGATGHDPLDEDQGPDVWDAHEDLDRLTPGGPVAYA